MPIEIQTITEKPNNTITFEFEDDIADYVVGISRWLFEYESSDEHHVLSIGLSLGANQPNARELDITVSAHMDDDGSDTGSLDNTLSSVSVTCVALTGSTDSNLKLDSADGIAGGSQSDPLPLPATSLAIGETCLAGFELAYDGGDHEVEEIHLSTSLTTESLNGYITAQASMKDSSGNSDSTANVDGGMIAASSGYGYLLAKSVTDEQTTSDYPVDFGQEIVAAGALLQSFTMSYGDKVNHMIRQIGGGTRGVTVDGSVATLDDVRAFAMDDSDDTHYQDDSLSKVSMIVFAVPKNPQTDGGGEGKDRGKGRKKGAKPAKK